MLFSGEMRFLVQTFTLYPRPVENKRTILKLLGGRKWHIRKMMVS